MRDFSDRPPAPSPAKALPQRKRLGGYLVEAGLLTPAQVDVALNDQKLTGMRFGEILAARGWVKQQTIEYLMHKVVLPEQKILEQPPSTQGWLRDHRAAQREASPVRPLNATSSDYEEQRQRRDASIAKPLPSVSTPDGDVSWVG